ncbi:MAG TPA: phosphohistidine phosphatase SixA [Chloroflexota bacterium]
MQLFLIRHGKAEPTAASDRARRLTGGGRKSVERVARRLKRADIQVDLVLCSTLTRARQTAEILSESLSAPLEEVDWLGPSDDVSGAERLVAHRGEQSIMLVGHLPFMQYMASYLLTRDPAGVSIHFSTGAAACFSSDGGSWQLDWLLTPDVS